jgi:CRP-like cAMP-binding protein
MGEGTVCSHPGLFTARVRELAKAKTADCQVLHLERHAPIYHQGESDDAVYMVDSGQVKLLVPTAKQQTGLVEIFAEGEIFGESCLGGQSLRLETAIAMRKSSLLRVPRGVFIALIREAGMLEEMARYLSRRVEEQKNLIAALLAVKKHHRLALTLLYLARKFGKREPNGTCIQQRILQEELAAMTGIRRTRVTVLLLKFRQLGLLQLNRMHQYLVMEERFSEYLESTAAGEESYGSARLAQQYVH